MIADMQGMIAKREEVWPRLGRFIREEAVETIRREPAEVVDHHLHQAMDMPVKMDRPLWWSWMTTYCVTEEIMLYERLDLPKNANILEVASGDQIAVPLSVECYTEGRGSYTTANLNQRLTEHFRRASAKLSIPLHVVEDDALHLGRHVPQDTFDVAVFQHAVNDILQSIAADQIGLDTVRSDWFEILPAMVQELARRHKLGTLEDSVRPEFMKLIGTVAAVIKPQGVLYFTHWEYEYDLSLDYPPDLYRSFIPMARRWIAESGLPLKEVQLKGFDPQYRLILRKQ